MKNSKYFWIDWLIIALYFAIIFTVCAVMKYRKKKHPSSNEKEIPNKVVGFSIYATGLSSITFLSVPGTAFSGNWMFAFGNLTICFLTPLLIYFFLPLFKSLSCQSLFENISKRYNLSLKRTLAFFYLLYNIFKISLMIYLPASSLSLIIESKSDDYIYLFIIVVGAVTIIYSYLSNFKQIVWINFFQTFLIIASLTITVIFLIVGSAKINALNFAEFIDEGKFLKSSDWLFSLTSASIPIILISEIINTIYLYGCSKDITQHYISNRKIVDTSESLKTNGIIVFFMVILFYILGSLLWAFFKHKSGYEINPDHTLSFNGKIVCDSDNIVTYYMWHVLPVGASAIALIGMLAASQSSISSSLNSISEIMIKNFLVNSNEKTKKLIRNFSISISGVFGVALALVFAGLGVGDIFPFFISISGFYSAPMVGIVLLGIFSKKANATDAYVGLITGLITCFITWTFSCKFVPGKHINSIYIPTLGFIASMLFSVLTSSFRRHPVENYQDKNIFVCFTKMQKKEFKNVQLDIFYHARYKNYKQWSKLKNLFLKQKIHVLPYDEYKKKKLKNRL